MEEKIVICDECGEEAVKRIVYGEPHYECRECHKAVYPVNNIEDNE